MSLKCFFGDTPGTVLSSSRHKVVVLSPPHIPQTVHVTLKDFNGSSIQTENDYFVYQGERRAYAAANQNINFNLAYADVGDFSVSSGLTTGLTPTTLVSTSDGTRLFVLNYDSDDVSVIDTNSNKLITTIGVGNGPYGACITPDDRLLFVLNYDESTVSVVNVATNQVTKTIDVGMNPSLASSTSDGAWVLVTNYGDDTLSMISVANLTVEATIGVGNGPVAVAITPDDTLALVANYSDTTISAINISTQTVVGTITVGGKPTAIAITPDNASANVAGLALVTSVTDDTVSFIKLSTLEVIATVDVGQNPEILLLTPDGAKAVVTDDTGEDSDQVYIIDVASRSVVGSSPYQGAEALGITPNGSEVLIAGNYSSDEETYPPAGYVEGLRLKDPFPVLGQSINFGANLLLILPDQAPLARFTTSKIDKRTVYLDASESLSPVGLIAFYIWDFGDGEVQTTTAPNVQHRYKKNGKYAVSLQVINSAGTSTDKVYNYQSTPVYFEYQSIGSNLFRNGGETATTSHKVKVKKRRSTSKHKRSSISCRE